MCGLDGAYCVAATAQGALKAGYKPILIKDAIITNKPERAAKLIHRLKAQGAQEQVVSNIC
ncbi:MAG: isochorismatase family protein [Sneathiella sp.]|nr:isochorismatase family protein [Sneathiella sp.]